MNYCSTCGSRVEEARSYCKHCGAKLIGSEVEEKPTGPRPETLIRAMTSVFVLGFIATIMLMGVMKVILGLSVESVLVFTLVPVFMIAVIEAVFIRLLFRSTRTAKPNEKQLASANSTNELDPAQIRVLAEPITSVTDHTTRAFDPVYAKRGQSENPQS